jgi:hypothetical protein
LQVVQHCSRVQLDKVRRGLIAHRQALPLRVPAAAPRRTPSHVANCTAQRGCASWRKQPAVHRDTLHAALPQMERAVRGTDVVRIQEALDAFEQAVCVACRP